MNSQSQCNLNCFFIRVVQTSFNSQFRLAKIRRFYCFSILNNETKIILRINWNTTVSCEWLGGYRKFKEGIWRKNWDERRTWVVIVAVFIILLDSCCTGSRIPISFGPFNTFDRLVDAWDWKNAQMSVDPKSKYQSDTRNITIDKKSAGIWRLCHTSEWNFGSLSECVKLQMDFVFRSHVLLFNWTI